jgi:hypothetical protein
MAEQQEQDAALLADLAALRLQEGDTQGAESLFRKALDVQQRTQPDGSSPLGDAADGEGQAPEEDSWEGSGPGTGLPPGASVFMLITRCRADTASCQLARLASPATLQHGMSRRCRCPLRRPRPPPTTTLGVLVLRGPQQLRERQQRQSAAAGQGMRWQALPRPTAAGSCRLAGATFLSFTGSPQQYAPSTWSSTCNGWRGGKAACRPLSSELRGGGPAGRVGGVLGACPATESGHAARTDCISFVMLDNPFWVDGRGGH